jgi:tetratricopeptide (TPR) repeat protein
MIKRDPYLAVAWYNKEYVSFELENNGNGNSSDDLDKKEKYQEAIKYIDNAIIIDSKISYEWYYKGCVLYRGPRKYQEAIKSFDKALEIDPNFAYAWYNKGLVLIELENYTEAIECFDGAIKCFDDDER